MTGFFSQNAVAIVTGLLAAYCYYALSVTPDTKILLTTAACGFLGMHLPNIQQPTLPSYRLIRAASWLASLLVPLAIFFYRPSDFIIAWVVTLFFTHSFWIIIDRVSLQRDFTRSVVGIAALPLMITGCTYLALGQAAVLPIFLACSTGYALFLLLEHFSQSKQLLSNS